MATRNRLRVWTLLVLVLLGGSAWAGVQASRRVEARDGDRCLACDSEIGESDFVLLHRGRRVPMHVGACEAHWDADPLPIFAKLQAKGALFQEAEHAAEHAGVSHSPWFWFGVYVLAGLISSAASAYVAVNRAQPPLAWFFAGLAGNVAALVVLLFIIPRGDPSLLPAGVPVGLAKVPRTRAPRACEGCGAESHPSASKCGGCGASMVPLMPSEVQSVS